MMEIFLATLMFCLVAVIWFFTPLKVSAHCDTMDGPTAKDGLKALETGNINYALKWIQPDGEGELQEAFTLSLKVRQLGDDAQALADRYFIESLIRIHRAGEGAPFTGVKPHGVPIDEKVAAADKCIETGNLSYLEGLVTAEELPTLKEKFEKAMALKDYDVNDVEAARKYIEAYVTFFKLAEGEEHEHSHHTHEHDHAHH